MSGDDSLTKELFASLVLNILTGLDENHWTINIGDFSLTAETQLGPKVLHLSRLYQDYLILKSPENFQTLTKQIHVLLSSRAIQAGDTTVLPRLLPYLRTYISLQHINESSLAQPDAAKSHEIVFFPYADVLGIGLVLDKDETQQHIRYLDLEKLNLEVDAAVDIAVQNLKNLSSEPLRVVQPGFYTSPWRDYYDGARLMLTELFTDVKVNGETVALSPTPDTLFVTGSEDALGLELLTHLAQSLMKSNPRATAMLPLVLRDGIWQPFILAPTDLAFDTIHDYRMNILNLLYQAQGAMLSASASKQTETFVAPFALDNDQTTNVLFSKTSVLEDTVCLIPQTDVVEFFIRGSSGKKECVARAPFEAIALVMNQNMLKDPNARPTRWHLSKFPSDAEVSQIGVMPPLKSPLQKTSVSALAELSRLFSLPLPGGARLDSELKEDGNDLTINFVLACTHQELKDFYIKNLCLGSLTQLKTEQGDFHMADVCSAHCTRTVLFGPSKIPGETLLRWYKKVDYNTPLIVNALAKQSDELLSLEQILGVSIIPESRTDGALKITAEEASQDFLAAYPPELISSFFRCQMSPLQPVYITPEDGTPHIIMAIGKMTVLVIAAPGPDGTLFNVTRTLRS